MNGTTSRLVGQSGGGRRSIRRFPRPLVSSLPRRRRRRQLTRLNKASAALTDRLRRPDGRPTAAGRVVFRAILSSSWSSSSRFRRLALPPVVHLPRRERKHEPSEVVGRTETPAWKSGLTAA